MPIKDLNSGDLWTQITEVLNEQDEHVCVLPMTTFIKPVRTVTLIQTDTTVTAKRSACPPGSVNLVGDPEPPQSDPEPDPEPEADPEPDPEPEADPEPDPEPEEEPRIVEYDEMKDIVRSWNFNDELNAAYSRDSPLMVRMGQGVMYKGKLTVGMDWNDNPAQAVIVQVDIANKKLLAHKRGGTRYYFNVERNDFSVFNFIGQSGNDVIDIENFG